MRQLGCSSPKVLGNPVPCWDTHGALHVGQDYSHPRIRGLGRDHILDDITCWSDLNSIVNSIYLPPHPIILFS